MSFCERGGMPVTGSNFAFSCPMVHEGVMRRSEEEFSEVTSNGMSPAACILMLTAEEGVRNEVGLILLGAGVASGCAV